MLARRRGAAGDRHRGQLRACVRRAPPPAQNLNDELRADRDSAPWMHRFEAELLREDDEPAFSRMLTGDPDEDLARTEPQFEARQPRPTPERNPLNGREPFYVKPDDRQAPIVRALRFGATAFSLLALVGVSALLVLLVAGGDRAATPVAERAAPAGQPVAAVDDATVSPPASASGAAPVVIASTGLKQDTSRIPAEEDAAPIPVQEVAAARGSGTVRPVDANSASAFAPARNASMISSWMVTGRSLRSTSTPARASSYRGLP